MVGFILKIANRIFPSLLACALVLSACASSATEPGDFGDRESVTLVLAAAASLEKAFADELIPLFEETYPWVAVEGTYDSSGKLQTQIENGLQADVFFSAAPKQMSALVDAGLVDGDSVTPLLENKIVLIKPAGLSSPVTGFSDMVLADVVALGDPESVPAGQYAREALISLGIWDEVSAQASFGTNVTEVLNWVAQGSADAGIVYATDAASTDKVEVLAEAPAGSLSNKVLYPVGLVTSGLFPDEGQLLLDFLRTERAIDIFAANGFTANEAG